MGQLLVLYFNLAHESFTLTHSVFTAVSSRGTSMLADITYIRLCIKELHLHGHSEMVSTTLKYAASHYQTIVIEGARLCKNIMHFSFEVRQMIERSIHFEVAHRDIMTLARKFDILRDDLVQFKNSCSQLRELLDTEVPKLMELSKNPTYHLPDFSLVKDVKYATTLSFNAGPLVVHVGDYAFLRDIL
jgi:hypothetical protein